MIITFVLHFSGCPPYWRNLDPYWKGTEPLMHRYFHPFQISLFHLSSHVHIPKALMCLFLIFYKSQNRAYLFEGGSDICNKPTIGHFMIFATIYFFMVARIIKRNKYMDIFYKINFGMVVSLLFFICEALCLKFLLHFFQNITCL